MTPSSLKFPALRELEDPLLYLPRKNIVDYRRNQIIFGRHEPCTGIYLVVRGRVKVSTPLDSGAHNVVDIYGPDQFFGEKGLLDMPYREAAAVALDNCSLMSWTTEEIEEHVERQPRLGLAFIQTLVQRCLDFQDRIQSLALDKTPERVARGMLSFARRFGTRGEDGFVRVPPMTHQLISEHVGTSREIVTSQMNHLRQLGLLRYSRRSIDVYVEALEEHLARKVSDSGSVRPDTDKGGFFPG